MYLKLDMESKTPLYQQIVNQISEGIIIGELQQEDRLPSVRRLATDIGINMHTVSKSYKILEQLGYIRMHRRKGAVVSNFYLEHNSNPQELHQLREMLRPTVVWAISSGISLKEINLVIAKLFHSLNSDEGRERQ